MLGYTFDIIKRDSKQDNLYNIFSSSVVDSKDIRKYQNIVLENEEGRLDLLSYRLYGSIKYVEELMVINNIINPFSIKTGDEIYYVNINQLGYMNKADIDQDAVTNTINVNKSTRIDPNRQIGVPPTIRPLDFKQVIVDEKSQTIKLNGKLS